MPHRPEQFFTSTKLYYESRRTIEPGEFLRSSAGALYLIERIRQSPTKLRRKYLDVLRFDPQQLPAGARVHPLYWYPRVRTRVRRRAPPLDNWSDLLI